MLHLFKLSNTGLKPTCLTSGTIIRRPNLPPPTWRLPAPQIRYYSDIVRVTNLHIIIIIIINDCPPIRFEIRFEWNLPIRRSLVNYVTL